MKQGPDICQCFVKRTRVKKKEKKKKAFNIFDDKLLLDSK